MNEPTRSGDPSQRLLAEVAHLRTRSAGRDRLLLRLGAVLMAGGPVLAVGGYVKSSQASNALAQNDATIMAIAGLTAAVVGVGLFVRYSMAEFLRFWMARLLAEQQPRMPVAVPPKRDPGRADANPNGGAAPPPPPGAGPGPGSGPTARPAPPRRPLPDPRRQEAP
jgi:hypothetical protein